MKFFRSIIRWITTRTSSSSRRSPPKLLATVIKLSNSAPSPENALAIFRDEWASRLPPPLQHATSGLAELFNDPRIQKSLRALGGIANQDVLELGPLEGGHTYTLCQAGARSVTAIEANPRAFLKCLIIKELFALRQADFAHGDFITFLQQAPRRFDLVVASGVLYHMVQPAELITLIAGVTDRVMLWTHYFDPSSPPCALSSGRFGNSRNECFGMFKYRGHPQPYSDATSAAFYGGIGPYSIWMERDDLLACLRHNGFAAINIIDDDPSHKNGPSITLIAEKASGLAALNSNASNP